MSRGARRRGRRAGAAWQDAATAGGRGRWATLALGSLLVVVPLAVGAAILALVGLVPIEGLSPRPPAGHASRPLPVLPPITLTDRVVQSGMEVGFAIGPAGANPGVGEIVAGRAADLWLTLADTATGVRQRLEQRPRVWVDLEKSTREGEEPLSCETKVAMFVQGSLGFRPDIDLNSYLVLALNADASISAIDPLVGVTGMTQLRSLVVLKSPGEDWVLTPDQRTLFVSMPAVGQVAVVDTESFRVVREIDTGGRPTRLRLEPGGNRLWVSDDSPQENRSGVTVVDAATLWVVARIALGAGPHEIAFSAPADTPHGHDPGRETQPGPDYAFVTNPRAGTLSVIDAVELKKVKDLKVGAQPRGMDFSSLSGALYVASEAEGTVSVVDVSKLEVVERLKVSAGTRALRFSLDGRWGFAVSPRANAVNVFDASTNRVLHTLKVEATPDQVAFTDAYAYVRSSISPKVSLIDLTRLEEPDPVPVVAVTIGEKPPPDAGVAADAIVAGHEHGNHVLIAQPGDQYIYYYMEGMNAPMGGLQNYSRTPRAVMVIDRSIRDLSPGVYSARIEVPQSGRYQVAVLTDSPRLVHCFSFTAGQDPSAMAAAPPLRLQILTEERQARPGQEFALPFRLIDPRDGRPVSEVDDMEVMVTLSSGLWQERFTATPMGEGVYEAALALPRAGTYFVMFAAPSLIGASGGWPSIVLQMSAD
jgi:DNA-binding beta-propeller fold protein YncE